MCTEQANPDVKIKCLHEYYVDLQKQNQQDPDTDITATEILIGPMMFQFLDLFAVLNMMPAGATMSQIRQLLPEEQSTNKEVLNAILSDHFFDEDECEKAYEPQEELEERDKEGKEKLYKLKPTYARLFEQRINGMLKDSKESAVAGIVDNRTQIMQVCDRLCNFFLKNKLQEKSLE